MKKLLLSLLVSVIASGASANNFLSEIGDGQACKVAFEVEDMRTPFMAGSPLGSHADDAYLKVRSVGDKANDLCQYVTRAGMIYIDGEHLHSEGVRMRKGDKFTASVAYLPLKEGGRMIGKWSHLMIIEKGAHAPRVITELAIVP